MRRRAKVEKNLTFKDKCDTIIPSLKEAEAMETLSENNETSYFLALQRMPGDKILIDISKLSIVLNYHPQTLNEIDNFTCQFSEDEIYASINEANIVDETYKNASLVIVETPTNKILKVLTKDLLQDFNLATFIRENIKNKQLMNNIAYKLGNLLPDGTSIMPMFKKNIQCLNISGLLELICSLPYEIERKFLIYIIEKYHHPKEESFGRKRDKAA